MCLLISGCGLFKKTVKTYQSSEHVDRYEEKSENTQAVKAAVSGGSDLKATEQKQVQKNINENTTVTADNIVIGADGGVKASGNAKLINSKKDRSNSNENKSLDQKDRYEGYIDTKNENKSTEELETFDKSKDTKVVSEPKGYILIWLAAGSLVFVIGLLFYFGIRPKKPKEENKS